MIVAVFVVCFLAALGHALPMDPRLGRPPVAGEKVPDMNRPDVNQEQLRRPRMPDTPGLDPEEYYRYWEEMAKANPAMLEHLQKMKPEELARLHPRLGERMARDSDSIRSRLEEARRMNMDELRELQRLQMMKEREERLSPDSEWIARQQAMRDHLPPNYDKDDVQKRIEEQRRILEEIDRKRRENFDRYEMQQELQRREKLKAMNEQERLRAEQEMRQRREQQMHHERMNKPASKKQFEEVWEEDDGLKDETFDPKTFFFLHDTNGDKVLDSMELQALFYNEVKKAYGPNTDNAHTQEELARMREYAMKEIDRNRDSLISLDEFMSYVHGDRFDDKDEWKAVVDEEEAFTEEEMHKFEEDYYDDYYDYEYDDKGNIVGFKEKTVPPSEHPTPVPHQPSVHEDKQMVGDPQDSTTQPPVPNEEHQQQQQQEQQQKHDDGMPGQQPLHIEPAGTQNDGQAQQFHKDPGTKMEGGPEHQLN